MARPIVLSNGELHVGINNYGLVHDFYFPYVGLENHSMGADTRHHVGVWVDGSISWLDNNSGDWQVAFSYPHDSLIGHTVATNSKIGVTLEFDDAVDAHQNAFLRNIHVINTWDTARDIRLFTHQAFAIGDSRSNTDTAQYLPDSHAILHYRGRRAFVVSGLCDNKPFDQYTVGLFGIEGKEGTYRDADDGELSMSNVEHGRVDSTLRFRLELGAHASARVHYWIAAGTSTREALHVDHNIRKHGIDSRLEVTQTWWHTWLAPARKVVDRVDEPYRKNFMHSIMIIKSQIDKRGAVIASTDSALLKNSRDAYAYCWPRDGAYVLWPLIRLGYTEEPLRFFEFCRRALHPSGYLMHKFRADGALGSSWHPYLHTNAGNISAAPIQEDETALVVFVFSQYYNMHHDTKLLDNFYESMVKPMADFLANYIDDVTHLPKPSYDLWEEVFLTTTYTTSVTYAALLAAADLAEAAGDQASAVSWRSVAEDISVAAHKQLFNTERQAFYKGLIHVGDDTRHNTIIDLSSTFGAFMYGLFPVDSKELKASVATIQKTFMTDSSQVGLPRYEDDYYLRANPSSLGNWWFISSLWMAQYAIETGNKPRAREILDWVNSHALPTGILSEQINPANDALLSVAPLTWSHAEFVATLLDLITEPAQSP